MSSSLFYFFFFFNVLHIPNLKFQKRDLVLSEMVPEIVNSPFIKQTAFSIQNAPSKVTNWRSPRTGLQITYINQPSPIVEGYFVVGTEIPDDSGCPHTLEHLIFLGSKDYPYKGFLDSLGNRFFSTTNAWTAVDRTVYTLTSAGWDGFKTLLPIYLDHLVRPTLTDEACLTEVYHIDGKGKEKGVVFSEMQGIENQSWFISGLNMQRSLYPPSSGYSSETGGLLSELRNLTRDKILNFHKSMYRPDNLCVVITGTINEAEMLDIMGKVDDKLPSLPPVAYKRPFLDSDPCEPPSKEIVKKVEFPDKDESIGEVILGWIGPKFSDTLNSLALRITGAYFTDSAISYLNKNIVEIENPLATDIAFMVESYKKVEFTLLASGVNSERLEEVDNRIKQLIKLLTDPKNFDFSFMKQILQREKLRTIYEAELRPGTFAELATSYFIYGDVEANDLNRHCSFIDDFNVLENWSIDMWCQFISRNYVDNPSVSILNRASANCYRQKQVENKQISSQIKNEYGKEGLQKLGQTLNEAKVKNDTPIPDNLISSFTKPDPSKIDFISTRSYKAGSNNYNSGYVSGDSFSQLLEKDTPSNLPLFFHFEDYQSKFITINLLMPLADIDCKLLRYIPILEEIFTFPVCLPDGKYFSHEEVVSMLNEEFISFYMLKYFHRLMLEVANACVTFESSKYDRSIELLANVLNYAVIDESKVKIVIEKLLNSLPDLKRSGDYMVSLLREGVLFEESSVQKAHNYLYHEFFYRELLQKIGDGNFEEIRKDLNLLRDQLFDYNKLKIFVVGGVSSLKRPVSSWSSFAKHFTPFKTKGPLAIEKFPRTFQLRSDIGEKCSASAYIASSVASQSSYLLASTLIPPDYLSDDIFKIALASEYLSAVEGPFWRGIRGSGLAYGACTLHNVETGYLTFDVYRASDAIQAWLSAKRIVEDYAARKIPVDNLSIEGAIAGIVHNLTDSMANTNDAAHVKISDNLLKRRGPLYVEYFLSKLNTFGAEDVVYVLNKYFMPLFSVESSVLFACVPVAKTNAFVEFLNEQGYSTTLQESTREQQGEGNSEEDSDQGSAEENVEESGEESSEDDDDE